MSNLNSPFEGLPRPLPPINPAIKANHFRQYLPMGTDHGRIELKNLIHQINNESAFDALGLFSVNLRTITTILSTVVTYLIIMVQFIPSQGTEYE